MFLPRLSFTTHRVFFRGYSTALNLPRTALVFTKLITGTDADTIRSIEARLPLRNKHDPDVITWGTVMDFARTDFPNG